uniref:Putative ovule protein n=1 Tax=Solanum chacoense TaxID=4108 RepID=A0A0V0IA18_SOLCH
MGKERYFGSKMVLKGRTFHPEVRSLDVVKKVLDLLYFQGWVDLFLDTKLVVYENEVVEFYVNLNVLEGSIASSSVNGVELVFDNVRLSKKFHIPIVGLAEYV